MPSASEQTPGKGDPQELRRFFRAMRDLTGQHTRPLRLSSPSGRGKSAGKSPVGKAWNSRGDAFRPDEWLERGGNVGQLVPDGVLVVDVDSAKPVYAESTEEHGGVEPFVRLVLDLGLNPYEAVAVRSGSGGTHWYFARDPDAHAPGKHDEYPGIDLLGPGRNTVAPGSVHAGTGETYRVLSSDWEDDATAEDTARPWPDLSEMPFWGRVSRATLEPLMGPGAVRDPGDGHAAPASRPLLTAEQLRWCLDRLDVGRFASNDAWLRLAMAAHHVTGGDPHARDEFLDWSASDPAYACETETVLAARRWDSFGSPEGRPVGVGTFQRILRDEGLEDDDRREVARMIREGEARLDAAEEAADMASSCAPEPDPRGLMTTTPSGLLTALGVTRLPPTEYLVPGFVPENGVTGLVAEANAGKTFLALHLALCGSLGLDPTDPDGGPGRRFGTYFLATEDPGGLAPRIRAHQALYGEVDHAEPRVFVQPEPIDLQDRAAVEAEADRVASDIREVVPEGELAETSWLFVVDTLSTNFGDGEESNPSDMARAIRNTSKRLAMRVRKTLGLRAASCLVLHHYGKDQSRGGRGGSSWIGNLDAEAGLRRCDSKGAARMLLHMNKLRNDRTGGEQVFEMREIAFPPMEGDDGGSSLAIVPAGGASSAAADFGDDDPEQAAAKRVVAAAAEGTTLSDLRKAAAAELGEEFDGPNGRVGKRMGRVLAEVMNAWGPSTRRPVLVSDDPDRRNSAQRLKWVDAEP